MLQWCDCYAPVVGRVLMGGYFLWSGILKLSSFAATVAFVASAGLPSPEIGAAVAIVVEIGLGLLMVLGWRMRMTALGLGLWTAVVAALYHSDFTGASEATLLLKDIAIMGGLLYMSAFGSGGWSLSKR